MSKTPRKQGRPPKPKSKRKSIRIEFVVTKAEKRLLDQAADGGSLGEFVRSAALDHAARTVI